MSEILKTRSELLFLYDAKDSNPNGDPLDENKPRLDEERGINLVTDVRLKRTIRDYFCDFKGYDGSGDKDIFVREIKDEKGSVQDGKKRASNFGKTAKEVEDNVLRKCIDVRLFGATIPLDKDSVTFTGPVQFKMGRSLHPVQINHIKGTGAFASGEGKGQATFREEYFVMYSLIGFYGIINENAAATTKLTDDDTKLLLEGIWNGTKNLISRSKVGQMPRLLLKIDYTEANFSIGDLENYIKINLNENISTLEKIRDVSDYSIDMTCLIEVLNKYKVKIKKINYLFDERMNFSVMVGNINQVRRFNEIITGFNMEEIKF